jgi:hypothetical protein
VRLRVLVTLAALSTLLPGCVLGGLGAAPPDHEPGPPPPEVLEQAERYLAALRDGDLASARREVCTEGFSAASDEDFLAHHGGERPRPVSWELAEAETRHASGAVGQGSGVSRAPVATVRFEDGREVEVRVWWRDGGLCAMVSPDDLALRLDPSPKGAAS